MKGGNNRLSKLYKLNSKQYNLLSTIIQYTQMLAASWGEPEACQHPIVLFCAIDYR